MQKAKIKLIVKYIAKYITGIVAGILFKEFVDKADFSVNSYWFDIGVFVLGVYIMLKMWSDCDKHKCEAVYYSFYREACIRKAARLEPEIYVNEFTPREGFGGKQVQWTGMLSVKRFASYCKLSGKYFGILFEQADVRNYDCHNLGGNVLHYSLDYDGTLYVIATDMEDFQGMTIRSKNLSVILHGRDCKTGNSEFDAKFVVNTNRERAVKKIVTPALQSALLRLTEETGRKLVLTVKRGRLYVFVNYGKSKAKPSLFRNINVIDEQEMRQNFSIIKSLVGIAVQQTLGHRLAHALYGKAQRMR